MLLVLAGRTFRETAEAALRRHGLSLRVLSALGHLDSTPASSYSDLARRAGVTPQSMQATLTTMEAEGLVRREGESVRGQAVRLRVTSRGRRRLTEGRRAITDAHEGLLTTLNASARQQLTRLLLTLVQPTTSPEDA